MTSRKFSCWSEENQLCDLFLVIDLPPGQPCEIISRTPRGILIVAAANTRDKSHSCENKNRNKKSEKAAFDRLTAESVNVKRSMVPAGEEYSSGVCLKRFVAESRVMRKFEARFNVTSEQHWTQITWLFVSPLGAEVESKNILHVFRIPGMPLITCEQPETFCNVRSPEQKH